MKFLSSPLLWFLLAVSLFFVGLGAVGLVGPDEPRYADVARAMLRSGDYITPRLFGSPWFEKPLYYWLAALFFRLGVNDLDARLPSALSACGFIGVWFWFSRRLFGKRAATLACILLASTLGWIGFAHAAVMDMLLATTLDVAIALLALWFWEKEDFQLYGFYALLGLATLAKGPVAVGLAGLVALAYVVTYGEWKALGKVLISPALGVFAIIAFPWYLLCYLRNGYPFIQEFFLKHNWERYISTALGHPQPIWFYIPILMAGVFPLTPLLLLPLVQILTTRPRAILANRSQVFLLYWVALPFIFFSFSQNKLPSYLLPILPPLTLWIALLIEGGSWEQTPAAALTNRVQDHLKRLSPAVVPKESSSPGEDAGPVIADHGTLQKWALWLIGLSALLLVTIPILASLLGDFLTMGLLHTLAQLRAGGIWSAIRKGPLPPAAIIFLAAPLGLSLYMLWKRNLLEAAFFVLVGVALSMLGIVQYISPSINRVASTRTVAQRIQVMGISGENLATYQLPRNQSLGLSFYMDHALPEWSAKESPASLAYLIAKDDEHLPDAQSRVFFPPQHLRLWMLPPTEFEIHIEPPTGKNP